MCGIAGCVAPAGEAPDRGALERMGAALAHRGPDDQGIAVEGSVGLVNRRLAIVDPTPAGHQPMRHGGGRWWLTYNGEVFNHRELRGELEPVPWASHADTESVLEALARWGEGALPRFNGRFGLAALDLDRRRLLLARDRWGVKPLYWARHAGAVWFASEMSALFAAGVPRRALPDVLAHAVVHGWANGEATPLEGIRRVLPGALVSVDLDTLETAERPWFEPAQLVDPERLAALAGESRPAITDMVEGELRRSVARRLMSDVPVGTFLSGGIDSSLVTAFTREEMPGVVAFNASVTDQPAEDEHPFATRVADHLGVELRTVRMSAETWRADFVEAVRHNEYPLMHESSIPMFQIAALARRGGVKVLLSGEGADELFGGYGFLHAGLYRDYLRANRRWGALARLAIDKLRRDGPLALLRSRRGAAAAEPPPVVPPEGSASSVAFDREAAERAHAAYASHAPERRALEAELLRELSTYLPHLLNRQDKNTMQASIETRVPFLDPHLAALALCLPLEARMEPTRKGVLRDIADRHLPLEVARRRKRGFGFDVRSYIEPRARPEFLLDGALRDLLEVDRTRWAEATVPARSSAQALRLWSGEVWCRAVLDGQRPDAVAEALWDGGP
jgi:asparagine synthase (glutamine-hydrolysing)